MPPSPPGQAVIIRSIAGQDILVDSEGRIVVAGVIQSGDIHIGSIQIQDGNAPGEVNTRVLPSGDYGLVVVPGEVNPLHSSQMNVSTILHYNASGDLIFIDKRISGTTYRKSVWKTDYTGNQSISESLTFGSYFIA